MKWIKPLSAALLLCVFSFWLGEAANGLLSDYFLTTLAATAFIIAWLSPTNTPFKLACGLLTCIAIVFCNNAGSHVYAQAYNQCVSKGEEVRQLLAQHQQKHQAFPTSLQQLSNFNHCQRYLHPSILRYQKTGKGYNLSFDDGMVAHIATESSPFSAQK